MNQKRKELETIDYDITTTGRHMLVTDAMKDYAFEKFLKVERFNTRIADVSFTMDIQRELNKVDISLRANNFRITSQAISTDMYASIDMAVDKIQSQIRRYKEKLVKHHSKLLEGIDMNVNVMRRVDDEVAEINEEIEEKNRLSNFPKHEVVSKEKKKLKQLTVEEAAMKLDLSGDRFLLFRCQEDMKLKLLYVRDDGSFALVEPE